MSTIKKNLPPRAGSVSRMSIGDRIVEAREKAGFEQAAFARKLKMKQPTLFRYDKNQRKAPGEVLWAIAELTGVSVAYLLHGKESPKEQDISAIDLAPLVSSVRNESLRAALSSYLREATTETDRHAITRFAFLETKDSDRKTPEEWIEEVRAFAARLKRGIHPLGLGARKMVDE